MQHARSIHSHDTKLSLRCGVQGSDSEISISKWMSPMKIIPSSTLQPNSDGAHKSDSQTVSNRLPWRKHHVGIVENDIHSQAKYSHKSRFVICTHGHFTPRKPWASGSGRERSESKYGLRAEGKISAHNTKQKERSLRIHRLHNA